MEVEKVTYPKRIAKSLRITPEASEMIATLAEAYETTEGRIVEGILKTYGPALLRDAQQESKK